MQLAIQRSIKPLTLSVLALAVAACSSVDNETAERGFKYLKVTPQPHLTIPAGVPEPSYTSDFEIPAVAPNANPSVGDQVDVRSPAQVITLVPGSRVEYTDNGIIYWFDLLKAESADATLDQMVNTVNDYIAYRGSSSIAVNRQAGIVQSDWLTDREEVKRKWWQFGRKTVTEQQQRYVYQVEVKPHGRTAGIWVDFVDAQVFVNGDKQSFELDDYKTQRLATIELNRLIGYVAERHQELDEALKLEREQQRLASMTEQERAVLLDESVLLQLQSQAGVVNYMAQADIDRTLERLRLVLPILGFEITDYIANTGKLYVSFKQPDEDKLAYHGLTGWEFEKGEYIFTVGSTGGRTLITLADEEDTVMKPAEVRTLYPYLAILMKMGTDVTDTLAR